MTVDIGAEAIARYQMQPHGITFVNKENPASLAGTITSIDIWARDDITGLRVGTFYTTNGDTLKCRASAVIAGTITAGSKVTKAVSIAVEIGDYIGAYWTDGEIEQDPTGYAGYWYLWGVEFIAGDEALFDWTANAAFSLGGYIPPPVVAPTVTTQDATDIGLD